MRLWQRVVDFRHGVRRTRAGRLTLQIVVGTIGAIVVVAGFVLVPLPGPGWLVVLAGLAILAAEFAWAQRLLAFTRAQVERWWRWISRQPIVVRLILGALSLAFVGAVLLLSLWLSFDIMPSEIWRFLTQ